MGNAYKQPAAIILTALVFLINNIVAIASETTTDDVLTDRNIAVENEDEDIFEDLLDDLLDDGWIIEDGDGNPITPEKEEEEEGLLINLDGSYNNGVIVGITGEYEKTSATEILKRINQIRKEACDKKYPNPYGTGNLKPSDYVPIKWSASLEAVSKYRAVEASCTMDHVRTNGKDIDSLCPKKIRSVGIAENLAFTNVMQGIKQCYDEKQNYLDYYNKGSRNGEIGHYLNLIRPDLVYIGVGSFKPSGDTCYAVSYTFTSVDGLDETKDKAYGQTTVDVECSSKYIDKLVLTDKKKSMYKDETYEFPAKVTIPACVSRYTHNTVFGAKTCKVKKGLTVTSSDESIITANNGVLTAVSAGKCVITAGVGNKAISREMTVKAPLEAEKKTVDAKVKLKVNKITSNITISTDYSNATTVTGKAIKAETLEAHTDISELLALYDVDLSEAITVTYKAVNNKKTFVDMTTHKNQPYFYPVLKLSNSKAKTAGMKKKQINALKKNITTVNKKLKAGKCYFYINPQNTKK